MVPLSRFIARATGSPFSHTGIVAIEDGSPVVYDCSSAGVQRQPFEVWMLDSLGPLGVKRLKPEHRERIAGVIGYCRAAFERQVPFDTGFRMDDDSFYCLELTEKAFRSQGLALSEPVRIGDWEYLASFPLTAFADPARHADWCWIARSHSSSRFTCPATSGTACGRLRCSKPWSARPRRCSRKQPLSKPAV